MIRAPLRRVCAGAVMIVGLLAPAGTAAAAPEDDPRQGGLWYVDAMHLDEAHARATGEGITVAVIDSPINVDVPELADADITVADENFCSPDLPVSSTGEEAEHGTNMTANIVGNGVGANDRPGVVGIAPGAQILYYAESRAELETRDLCDDALYAEAFSRAVADGADIISVSAHGALKPGLVDAIAEAQRAGVIVVAGVPNEGTFGPDVWPAWGNGVVVLESSDVTSTVQPPRVTSSLLTAIAPGDDMRTIYPDPATGAWTEYRFASGTSHATATTAGALAVAWSAAPDATANQMIQSLVRNAGAEPKDDPMARNDDVGYGIVNLPQMLAADPTTYPDENPLIRDDADALPTRAQIEGDDAPSASTDPSVPAESGTPSDDAASADDDAASPVLVVVLVVLGIVAIAAVVLGILLARRRAR